MEALPGSGIPDDDAITGRVTDGPAPETYVPLKWRTIVWPAVKDQLKAIFFYAIVAALFVTVVVWFFVNLIGRQHVHLLDVLRYTYLGVVVVNALGAIFYHAVIGLNAAVRRMPYRLMYEGIAVAKLHKNPRYQTRFGHMTRTELADAVMVHRRLGDLGQLLAGAMFGALADLARRRRSGGYFG